MKISPKLVLAALAWAALTAQTPSVPGATPDTVAAVLAARKSAMQRLHARAPARMEITGTLTGLGLVGFFHAWHDGDRDRFDEHLGVNDETTLRVGDAEYMVNASGDVRRIHGLIAQRQRTEDFVESGEFLDHPERAKFLKAETLPDGRNVTELEIEPPHGQPWVVALDGATAMIDRVSYIDTDRWSTIDYYDYRTVGGALLAFKQITSDGDHAYDVTQRTTDVRVDKPIANGVFAVPASEQIQTDKPVTVPLVRKRGAWYVPVQFHGHSYEFLLDSGSQGIVVDSRVAAENLLVPQGQLEVAGARRTSSFGVASLDALTVGGVLLPVRVATVLDLGNITAFRIDGILGYPFFAEAEVRIDPDRSTLTVARPGALPALGQRLALDADRELPELQGRANGEDGRFLVDTGNGTEVLLFHRFVQAHPGMLSLADSSHVSNFGVGGSMNAIATRLNELDIGPFRLFNRQANVLFTDSGAFADQFTAGNIGLPNLDQFVTTFDVANEALYLQPGSHFDDGRYRPVYN